MSTSAQFTPDLPALIWLGVRPFLKLLLVSSAGIYLGKKGILNPAGLHLMSKTLFTVLYPCLLFSKIAAAVNTDNIANAGSLLMSSSFFLLFGVLGGLVIRKIVGEKSGNFQGGIISACVWGNWGDLLFAMIFSLGNSPPFQPGDALTGIAYLSFLILTWNISFFPMGGTRLIENDFKKPSKAAMESETSGVALNDLRHVAVSSNVAGVGVRSENEIYDSLSPLPITSNEYSTSSNGNIALQPDDTFFGKFKHFLIAFLTAPNVALLAGIVVGVTPPIKALFVPNGSENESPPLQFVMDSADFIGAAAVPIALINLGAALARMKVDVVQPLTVSLIAIFRLVVCPIVSIFGTEALVHCGAIDREDKMLRFVIMWQGCTPSATSNVFITQLYNNGEAGPMAAVLLAQYTLGVVSMVVCMIVILMLLF